MSNLQIKDESIAVFAEKLKIFLWRLLYLNI